jgi:hypothetical protein
MRIKYKRGKKSPESGWRFLRSHERLPGIVEAVAKSKRLSYTDMGDRIDCDGRRIARWFRGDMDGVINEFQIVQLCDLLGIELDLDIKITE